MESMTANESRQFQCEQVSMGKSLHRIKKTGNVMRLCALQEKQVINVCDCKNLGNVMDIEFDECSGCVESLVVPGPCKLLGVFGREFEYDIPFRCVKGIGADVILVEINEREVRRKISC